MNRNKIFYQNNNLVFTFSTCKTKMNVFDKQKKLKRGKNKNRNKSRFLIEKKERISQVREKERRKNTGKKEDEMKKQYLEIFLTQKT